MMIDDYNKRDDLVPYTAATTTTNASILYGIAAATATTNMVIPYGTKTKQQE